MEKYIFDCRQKLYESPKFLKRNQNISCQSLAYEQLQSKPPLPYLKNKVFLTFDYSYYQIIPQTASIHLNNRVNNSLYSLVGQGQHEESQTRKIVTSFSMSDSKWRKQKENMQVSDNLQIRRNSSRKHPIKKIKIPINCMPGVGDYRFQTKNIQKRIVYDVKIRGKPQQALKIYKFEQSSHKEQDLDRQKTKKNTQKEDQYKSSKKINRKNNSLIKDRKLKAKLRQNQEQYLKFITAIDATNVWNRLMQKYRLKGTKFDTHGFND